MLYEVITDLYDGEHAHDAQEAGEMMRGLDQEVTDRKLLTALAWLKGSGRRVAVLGWSLGGHQALQTTILEPESRITSYNVCYTKLLRAAGAVMFDPLWNSRVPSVAPILYTSVQLPDSRVIW